MTARQKLQSRESRESRALMYTAYFRQACCELAFQPADLCAPMNLRLALARARAIKQSREGNCHDGRN